MYFLNLQVRYETPPRFRRTEGTAARMLLKEGQVIFHFKPSLASEWDGIPLAIPRDLSLREASLKLRSLFNVGPDKCANLVLGEASFTEVRHFFESYTTAYEFN